MKKLLILLMVLFMTACAPDENTATEMQWWLDACQMIESCSTKIDDLIEEGLTEAELIVEIQATIADHEARLQDAEARLEDHETRIQALEDRENLVDTILTAESPIYQLLEQHGFTHIMYIDTNNDYEVRIYFNLQYVIDTPGYTLNMVEDPLRTAIQASLGDVVDPEDVTIIFFSYTFHYEIPLTEILE
jgi:hypothetical protein